jgi:hypothetical protein
MPDASAKSTEQDAAPQKIPARARLGEGDGPQGGEREKPGTGIFLQRNPPIWSRRLFEP